MREEFSPVNNFSFLMDLLLSIISYQLTQQGAAFQSSDDNNCHLELHHSGLVQPAFPALRAQSTTSRLWESLSEMSAFLVLYSACVPVSPCTQNYTNIVFVLLLSSSTPSQPGLSSALMITNHHPASQPASQALHCLSLNILNSPGPGFPVPTSWWLCEV